MKIQGKKIEILFFCYISGPLGKVWQKWRQHPIDSCFPACKSLVARRCMSVWTVPQRKPRDERSGCLKGKSWPNFIQLWTLWVIHGFFCLKAGNWEMGKWFEEDETNQNESCDSSELHLHVCFWRHWSPEVIINQSSFTNKINICITIFFWLKSTYMKIQHPYNRQLALASMYMSHVYINDPYCCPISFYISHCLAVICILYPILTRQYIPI